MKEKFLNAFKEALEIEEDKVEMSDVMSDFDTWDSMSRLSLIALLDEHFEIEISDDEFENMTTVQDLYDKVQTKVQADG
ncbi:acyl carrier protein AcpP [Psychroflexus torquis ATCC 700755]|uniref:Acyl carrier protein AcpP n=1 Tax=Psychroflexus torquis (strain ATCC 700755 / CIP 106069 / ACAM 623) TaxID=313595 RepID=K4IF83_PSYTT|nr:acyl carrier protein [Psychroflexus torquis]AFU68473.1 acyl carrier protein AcpP [Psychroflexus torquis ATCC 700755]